MKTANVKIVKKSHWRCHLKNSIAVRITCRVGWWENFWWWTFFVDKSQIWKKLVRFIVGSRHIPYMIRLRDTCSNSSRWKVGNSPPEWNENTKKNISKIPFFTSSCVSQSCEEKVQKNDRENANISWSRQVKFYSLINSVLSVYTRVRQNIFFRVESAGKTDDIKFYS